MKEQEVNMKQAKRLGLSHFKKWTLEQYQQHAEGKRVEGEE